MNQRNSVKRIGNDVCGKKMKKPCVVSTLGKEWKTEQDGSPCCGSQYHANVAILNSVFYVYKENKLVICNVFIHDIVNRVRVYSLILTREFL